MPKRLSELRTKFQRIGRKKIFGEGTIEEIHTSLHRLGNKTPSKKTTDLAKRILSVINGHGTDYDILNFKLLLREFQIESQLNVRDLFRFLRHSKAPKTSSLNTLKIARLDRNTLQYSEFLELVESLAETIEISPNMRIIKHPGNVSPRNRELLSRFVELKTREEKKAMDWLTKHIGPKESKQIIGKEVIFGTVVIIIDSKKDLPDFVNLGNERGNFKPGDKKNPSIIVIDVNANKRIDNVDIKTSLVHELRHSLFEMFRRLMISDPHNPIVSATLNLTSPELNVAARSRRELILHDREIYETLLERQLSPEDIENITKQRAYLDELHSSVMQRKPSWFRYDEKVYSKEVSSGKHFEMVGSNLKDIKACNDMFCHIQGFYMLDLLASAAKDPNNPWAKVIGEKFKGRIPKYFDRMGSIIATSLTTQQASRLIAELWKTALKEFPNIDIKLILSGLTPNQKGKPSNGQTIEQFLSQ